MTYIKKFCIKRVSADIEEARIVRWAVAPGAAFKAGDTLLEMETDKSVIEIAAEEDGTLSAQLYAEGDAISFDVPVAEFEVEGEAPEEPEDEAPEAADGRALEQSDTGIVGAAPIGLVAATIDTDRLTATPAARSMAAELGLDLREAAGTGPGGRITRADVAALSQGRASGSAVAQDAGSLAQALARARADTASAPSVPAVGSNTAVGVLGRLVFTRHGAINIKVWPPRQLAAAPMPTIVLLHGMFGDMDTWAAMASALTAAGMGVMAVDLPGHGDSPSNASTIDQVVEGLVDVLEQSVTGPMALIGHSFGAAVAARVASRVGERLQSLIMLAPVGLGTEIGQSFLSGMTNAHTEEAIARELRKLTEASASLSVQYLRTLLARLHERHQVLNALCSSLARNGVQQIDISIDLAAIRRPMTIIQGRNDGIVPWAHVLNAPPRAALHLIPGVGHMPQWEAPGLTVEIILATLAACN